MSLVPVRYRGSRVFVKESDIPKFSEPIERIECERIEYERMVKADGRVLPAMVIEGILPGERYHRVDGEYYEVELLRLIAKNRREWNRDRPPL